MKTTTIFTRAHAMTRAICAEFADADYRATFAAALRIAWADAQNDPRAAWEAMTGEAQNTALDRMVKWCMNRDSAETDASGNFRPNYFNWIACADDITATAHEAWLRMPDAFTNAERAVSMGKRDSMPSIRAIMANACRTAARYIARQEYRNARAIRIESKTDEDGNTYLREYIKDAQSIAEPIAPNPETAMLIRDSIERACKDDIDRAIIDALADGMTQTEIGARVGMTQKSISIRIKEIRARYAAENAPDEYAPDVIAYRIRKRIANA